MMGGRVSAYSETHTFIFMNKIPLEDGDGSAMCLKKEEDCVRKCIARYTHDSGFLQLKEQL